MSARLPIVLLLALFWLPVSPAQALFGITPGKTTQWIVDKVNDFLPGELTYGAIEGPLAGPIRFTDLRYRDGELDVAFQVLELDWSLARLLLADVRIQRVFARGVVVRLPTPAPDTEPEPAQGPALPDITLPVDIQIQDLDIAGVTIHPPAGESLVIDALKARIYTEDDAFVVDTLTLKASQPQAGLDLKGRIKPVGPWPLDLDIGWNYTDPRAGAVSGQGRIAGELRNDFQLGQTLSGAVAAVLEAKASQVFQQPTWDARLEISRLDMGLLDPQLADAHLTGQLVTRGSPEDFQADGQFAATLPELGQTRAVLSAVGSREAIRVDELSLSAADSPLSLQASADLDLVQRTVDAQGRWQALAWPLVGEPQIQSPTGQFSATGTFQDYRAELEAALEGRDFGRLAARLKAQGSDQQVQVTELSLVDPQGELALDLTGRLAFADLRFQAQGQWAALAWPLAGEPQVQSPQGRFSATGTPQDYRASVQAAVSGAQFGQVDADLEAQGSDQRITLGRIHLTNPDRKLDLTAQGELGFADLAFQAQGQWRTLTWPLVGEPQIRSDDGQFSASGTPQDYQARLQAALESAEFGTVNARAAAAGSDQRLRVSELSLSAPEGDLSLDAQGEFSLVDQSFDATGQWRSLVWPLVGEPQVQSPEGRFQAKGRFEDYTFTLNTLVKGPAIPEGRWALEGQGSDQALERFQLTGQVLGGEVRGQASARWQPGVSWQAELGATGLNPSQQWPEAPNALTFKALSQGSLGERLQATAQLTELSGALRGQPLDGRAELAVDGDDLAIKVLRLRAGEARLDASGTLQDTWDLAWELNIPKLGNLLPAASGTLQGSGAVRGPRAQPAVELKLSGDELAVGETQISQLRGQALVDAAGNTPSRLDVSATELVLGGQPWRTLTLKGNGTPSRHDLAVTLNGDPARLELGLDGGLEGDIWRGVLNRLAALGTAAGDWSLTSPAALSVSAQQATAQAVCLASRPSQVCVEGGWSAAAGAKGELSLSQLDLARFETLLPENVGLDVILSGTARGESSPAGRISAQGDFGLSPGNLRLISSSGPVTVRLGGGSVNARIEDTAATGKLTLDLGGLGQVDADLAVRELGQANRLNGSVNARIDDLALVSAFVPQVANTEGRLLADLQLGGTLPVPVIKGELRVVDAAADLPDTGTRVHNVQLGVVADGSGPLTLGGSAESGAGKLTLDGLLDPAGPRLDLNIVGENFEAMATQEIQVIIAPDLSIRLADGDLRVQGEVKVPKALISPPDISSGVAVSDDVVIVNDPNMPPEQPEATQNPEQPAGLDLFASVRVTLGDDVRVEAAGFKGKLDGSLLVEQTPQLAPRGTGAIQVETGQYKVYGQELDINRGRVLFSGGPVDNPGLDLEVARDVDDVTAGVQVTGTVKNPRLQLYSDPVMPDTSILSYLLFGRPPDARSGSESELLYKAAAAIGFSGGNLVTERLSEAFQLDTFKFESGDTVEEASLVVGKYLSPELYVSYGIGLFEAVNTFNLRYQLSKRLVFESTTSGENNSADLVYTIER